MSAQHPRRALASCSDKSGLEEFAKGLIGLGFEIVSTGGTRRFLEERRVPVVDISAYTGFPEIMDGRVKTLHPKVHGAILGRPDLPDDRRSIEAHGIVPFELVVCNLYPFEETIARQGATVDEAIEQIDIGGPSMIRSAAKNHAYVAVVTRPDQYDAVLEALRKGTVGEKLRRELAASAFEMTARYDRAIADYMAALTRDGSAEARAFSRRILLSFDKEMDLRYGENPHQRGAFYVESPRPRASLASARVLHGKELSYNNLLDLDAALALVREFERPAAAVIKHNNPCGCAIGETLADAFDKAYAGDPVSAFGSILAFNRPLDASTAERLCEPGRFIEAIIAPKYEDRAYEALTTRPKWKNNVRLLACETLSAESGHSLDYRRVGGGLLVQDRDDRRDEPSEWKTVTARAPNERELADLAFAWSVGRHVKSNAIVFARDGAVVGVGAGQMSRVDSMFLAVHKSGDRSQGAVVGSDAFFPFRDAVDLAARAGITAIVQPGGSRNDADAISACDEHHMAMVFTGRRHFKH
jgi:phosphoribosylaminoimidazolecarboxamide formyltransferase/IMP cyclohydrolase